MKTLDDAFGEDNDKNLLSEKPLYTIKVPKQYEDKIGKDVWKIIDEIHKAWSTISELGDSIEIKQDKFTINIKKNK